MKWAKFQCSPQLAKALKAEFHSVEGIARNKEETRIKRGIENCKIHDNLDLVSRLSLYLALVPFDQIPNPQTPPNFDLYIFTFYLAFIFFYVLFIYNIP